MPSLLRGAIIIDVNLIQKYFISLWNNSSSQRKTASRDVHQTIRGVAEFAFGHRSCSPGASANVRYRRPSALSGQT